MKTSGRMNGGGQLRSECRAAWAMCFVKFIQAYAAEGVPIWGLTVQNEPQATQRWDSCIYSAEEERDFVRDHLGPALQQPEEGLQGAVQAAPVADRRALAGRHGPRRLGDWATRLRELSPPT